MNPKMEYHISSKVFTPLGTFKTPPIYKSSPISTLILRRMKFLVVNPSIGT